MKWAKFPIAWMHPKVGDDSSKPYTLADVLWRDYAASGMAALMLLMLLAIECNRDNYERRKKDKEALLSSRVRMSYDEIKRASGFHKMTIGKAISLLEAWGAITVETHGRSNVYVLTDLENAGGWRKLPVSPLFHGEKFFMRDMPRKKTSLNALKLYFVLLRLFNDQFETTSVSYTAISKWTGIRREEIPVSIAILASLNLVRPSFDRDARHDASNANDQSQRYWIAGLSVRNGTSANRQAASDAFDVPSPPVPGYALNL